LRKNTGKYNEIIWKGTAAVKKVLQQSMDYTSKNSYNLLFLYC